MGRENGNNRERSKAIVFNDKALKNEIRKGTVPIPPKDVDADSLQKNPDYILSPPTISDEARNRVEQDEA